VISVITASLPTRSAMLAECVASVAAQTLAPIEHLISVDHARVGSSRTRNRLMQAAGGTWIAVLDDDDVMFPDHLAALWEERDRADVIYSFCEVTGRSWNPNRTFDPDVLRGSNYIPITTLIRADLVRGLGGWQDGANGWEDWDFWLRALDAGARFVCVPRITWRYRFHRGNKTTVGEKAAA